MEPARWDRVPERGVAEEWDKGREASPDAAAAPARAPAEIVYA